MSPAVGRPRPHPHPHPAVGRPSSAAPARASCSRVARALLALGLVVGLAACTGDGSLPTPADGGAVLDLPETAETVEPTAPAVPTATETAAAASPTPIAPVPPRRPDAVVLLHLAGPVTDAGATDVVVRFADGEEVDRFRLAGAVGVHAGPDGRWALVETIYGGWARYDATVGSLSLLTFEGDPPVPHAGAIGLVGGSRQAMAAAPRHRHLVVVAAPDRRGRWNLRRRPGRCLRPGPWRA